MTVIAYSSKHRILASDSRCATETVHVTTCQKVFRLRSGALLGSAGDGDDRDLISLLEKATPRKMPSRLQLIELKSDFAAILVFPKGQVYTVETNYVEHGQSYGEWTADVLVIHDTYVAIGCGLEFAYGAMEHGATPIEAVRIACRRSLHCALPVQWESLKERKAA
jgi:hypothetical protein